MSLHKLIEAQFGVDTREEVNNVTVGTSVVEIAQGNPNRANLTITNNGGTAIRILFQNDVSTTRGIAVPPGGSTAVLNWSDDFLMPTRAWFAVSSAAGNAVTVVENIITRVRE